MTPRVGINVFAGWPNSLNVSVPLNQLSPYSRHINVSMDVAGETHGQAPEWAGATVDPPDKRGLSVGSPAGMERQRQVPMFPNMDPSHHPEVRDLE